MKRLVLLIALVAIIGISPASAEETCQKVDDHGDVCADADESEGTLTAELANDELGYSLDVYVHYSL